MLRIFFRCPSEFIQALTTSAGDQNPAVAIAIFSPAADQGTLNSFKTVKQDDPSGREWLYVSINSVPRVAAALANAVDGALNAGSPLATRTSLVRRMISLIHQAVECSAAAAVGVGAAVGFGVGAAVGFGVGVAVGFGVGAAVGFDVGAAVGFDVGAAVGVGAVV